MRRISTGNRRPSPREQRRGRGCDRHSLGRPGRSRIASAPGGLAAGSRPAACSTCSTPSRSGSPALPDPRRRRPAHARARDGCAADASFGSAPAGSRSTAASCSSTTRSPPRSRSGPLVLAHHTAVAGSRPDSAAAADRRPHPHRSRRRPQRPLLPRPPPSIASTPPARPQEPTLDRLLGKHVEFRLSPAARAASPRVDPRLFVQPRPARPPRPRPARRATPSTGPRATRSR